MSLSTERFNTHVIVCRDRITSCSSCSKIKDGKQEVVWDRELLLSGVRKCLDGVHSIVCTKCRRRRQWQCYMPLQDASGRRQNTPLLQHCKCSHANGIRSCKITSSAVREFMCLAIVEIKANFHHVSPSVLVHQNVSNRTSYQEIL